MTHIGPGEEEPEGVSEGDAEGSLNELDAVGVVEIVGEFEGVGRMLTSGLVLLTSIESG